jgi:exopolysaccharide biosynthesis polyprenyl glycosylphosphotransferase
MLSGVRADAIATAGERAHEPEALVEPVEALRTGLGPVLRVLLLGKRPRLWQDVLRRRVLAVADLLSALVVFVALGALEGVDAAGWAVLSLPIWLLLAKLFELYDRDHRALRHLTTDEFLPLVLWALSASALTGVLLGLTPAGGIRIETAVAVWWIAVATAAGLRALARFLWRRATPPEQTLIVGEGPLAEATRRKLELFPDIHVALVRERDLGGALDRWTNPDRTAGVRRIVLATSSVDEDRMAELVAFCRQEQVKLSVVPPMRGIFGTAAQLSHIADLPVVEYTTWDVSRSTLLLKRALDVALGGLLLVAAAPLMCAVALAVRLDSTGSALFAQRRAGLGGRTFTMLKFRTMIDGAERRLPEVVSFDELPEPMFKIVDDPRATRVGRFLRRTSLDELPQLINVVRGDMSLVGPRPEQVELVERYRPEHLFRLAVKPGLTGPMQVYGRGELTFDERLALEREYVENLSLARDLRLLALTLRAVGGRLGAY